MAEEKYKSKLLDQAKALPKKPGCYLMKNSKDEVIYVGKAKNLRARVSSYFQNSAHSAKTTILVSHIRDFDFMLTESDSEAFVLENNLIKKFTPRYNIMMRDDKSYPYIVLDTNEPYPRFLYQRRFKRSEKKKVFGPFAHGSNISEVLRILTKSFELRDCTLREFNSRKTPCLLYQIKQCSAPCVGHINSSEYDRDLNNALGFFEGRGEQSLSILKQKMESAAHNEEFELAALLRDNIQVLEEFLNYSIQKNVEFQGEYKDIDIIAYVKGDVEVDVALYSIRNRILIGKKNFHFPLVDCLDDLETEVMSFIYQYYNKTIDTFPELLIFSLEDENEKVFKEALASMSSIRMNENFKQFESLLKLTRDYAYEQQKIRSNNATSVYLGLEKLQQLIGLSERPVRLECYDVAIFQGKSPTASCIVSIDGKLEKSDYRYYHLQERPEGNNDFAMMAEVLERRLKYGNLPDVFIVDGGKGQVNIFIEVLKEKEIDIPVVGIAKSKMKSNFKKDTLSKSEERLVIPGRLNDYILNKNKALLQIVTGMRDEAHRFSRKLHHKKEKSRLFSSWLDHIPGVGPKTKEKVLGNIKVSPSALREQDVDQISQELKISPKMAKKIKDYLESVDDVNSLSD
jgi:excinuclease ABC subunit C